MNSDFKAKRIFLKLSLYVLGDSSMFLQINIVEVIENVGLWQTSLTRELPDPCGEEFLIHFQYLFLVCESNIKGSYPVII